MFRPLLEWLAGKLSGGGRGREEIGEGNGFHTVNLGVKGPIGSDVVCLWRAVQRYETRGSRD
jgi:hypothetical protein